jgi:Skp family chaperone for outer membrane proteins
LTIGLALSGLVSALGRARGQTPKSEGNPPLLGLGLTAAGSVDLEAVFERWPKVHGQRQAFGAEAGRKQAEVERVRQRAMAEFGRLHVLRPGTPEYDRTRKEYERLGHEVADLRRRYQDELTRRETERLADLLHEVRVAVAEVARRRGLSIVFRAVSPARRIAVEVEAVKEAIAAPLLYTDPGTDITEEVLTVLNGK